MAVNLCRAPQCTAAVTIPSATPKCTAPAHTMRLSCRQSARGTTLHLLQCGCHILHRVWHTLHALTNRVLAAPLLLNAHVTRRGNAACQRCPKGAQRLWALGSTRHLSALHHGSTQASTLPRNSRAMYQKSATARGYRRPTPHSVRPSSHSLLRTLTYQRHILRLDVRQVRHMPSPAAMQRQMPLCKTPASMSS